MPIPHKLLLAVITAVLLGSGCAAVPPAGQAQAGDYGNNPGAGTFVPVNGARLYYEAYGTGDPLLVLHGNEQSIATMRKQIAHFARSRRVIALDSRAHGQSSRGDGELTYELLAQDVAALLRSLHLASVDVLGWSDGGNVALLLAMTEPELVGKVAVMGAALSPQGAHDWAFPMVESQRADILDRMSKTPDPAALQSQLDLVDLLLQHPNIAPERLKAISSPVLVMAGDEDVIRNEHTLEIYQHIPHAQLCIFPGSTHFVPLVQPDLFNSTVEAFLSRPFARPTSKAMLLGD
jgi:pimeloyl-ACP methyl ester carboxylesterase